MAQAGKNASLKLDEAVATLTEIRGDLEEITLTLSRGTSGATPFGANSEAFVAALRNGTFSVSGFFSAARNTHLVGILADDAAKTFQYAPLGATTGLPLISGECLITEYAIQQAVAERIPFTASFQITGDVTLGTVP